MIRKATINDFDLVYELYMHPSINPYLLYEPMERSEFRSIYHDLIEKNLKFIFFENDQEIGMFKLIPLTFRTSHVCYLGGVGIHPKFSGRGFGKKMMEEILKYAIENGFKRIELSVSKTNHKAIKLYESVGFEKEGILRNYTSIKSENKIIDEVLMSFIVN